MILSLDMLESHSRPLKTQILAKFFKKTGTNKIACWVGAQGQVNWVKKVKTCTHCDTTHTECQTQNKKNFLNLN